MLIRLGTEKVECFQNLSDVHPRIYPTLQKNCGLPQFKSMHQFVIFASKSVCMQEVKKCTFLHAVYFSGLRLISGAC